jgi:hypothetical protein
MVAIPEASEQVRNPIETTATENIMIDPAKGIRDMKKRKRSIVDNKLLFSLVPKLVGEFLFEIRYPIIMKIKAVKNGNAIPK